MSLFEMPVTHTPLKLPTVVVALRATVRVHVKLDPEHLFETAHDTDPAEFPTPDVLHLPDSLKWAVESLAWGEAEEAFDVDVQVDDVRHTSLPDGWTWERLAGELKQPTMVQIDGAA